MGDPEPSPSQGETEKIQEAGNGKRPGRNCKKLEEDHMTTDKRTIEYYDKNAMNYYLFSERKEAAVRPIRSAFTALLPPHGTVLDAGCGTGRDTSAFLDAGFRVSSFDASMGAVNVCRRRGLRACVGTFESALQVYGRESFDGVWACHSLLHVPDSGLGSAIRALVDTVKEGGYLMLSFKLAGHTWRTGDGRLYTSGDGLVDRIAAADDRISLFQLLTYKAGMPGYSPAVYHDTSLFFARKNVF
jgi:SAM-dependent methyltransferase